MAYDYELACEVSKNKEQKLRMAATSDKPTKLGS